MVVGDLGLWGWGTSVSSLLVVFGRAARARSRARVLRVVLLLVFAIAATIGVFGDSAAHAAGGGYGPGIAGPAGAPGGFSNIVTTQAFDNTRAAQSVPRCPVAKHS